MFDRFSWLNRKQYDQAHLFYREHGRKAFLISRYIPVVRALVPFVAGVAHMDRSDFRKNNVFSVSVWVLSITLLAFFVGNIPFVKNNYEWIILGIAVISILPMLTFSIKEYRKAQIQ